uniref:Uncharacterized protein n=1 Tax=Anguilla anguilla TaxID=7936 RepID=A0A0E9R8H6_ANGAN
MSIHLQSKVWRSWCVKKEKASGLSSRKMTPPWENSAGGYPQFSELCCTINVYQ